MTNNQSPLSKIPTIDRLFRHRPSGMDGTFQPRVIGKKDAIGTGNLVHSLGIGRC
jgi:hypothetical protein